MSIFAVSHFVQVTHVWISEKENQDTYRGVLWLRDNRDKFTKPVHDPIMLSLDVKDKSLARYVETHIGRADLEGFVCENPEDVNILTKQLRENMKLRKTCANLNEMLMVSTRLQILKI